MKPRIYISGPISGYPELNRPAFERAGEKLQQAGFDPIDPFDCKPACEAPEWADYMKADVAALVTCDGVATLSGWQESRGACVEVRLAQDLGIPVMALRRWTESR